MKSSCLLGFAALSSVVTAFPSVVVDAGITQTQHHDAVENFEKRQVLPPTFNAQQQYVSNKGKYKFVAPGPSDARGPCPGLNAMANHGYLPHNGIATIPQMIQANIAVFGMGQDLASFLAVYGAILDGNGAAWSIGGPSSNLPSIGVLGTPTGMSGSHNKYENDASPMRGDLFLYGNDYETQIVNFQNFYNRQSGVADQKVNYDLNIIAAFRAYRFDDSISRNKYFFNGPFSGAIASPAAYSFIYRFMANKSAEYPEGRLDREVLKSFYSITGQPGSFHYTPGYEAIPDNWYTRASDDLYTIPYFNLDFDKQVLAHPEFFSVGGNLGKTNSFTGIDPGNLTGGAYQLSDLKNPQKFRCFVFELLIQSAPDLLEGLFTDVTAQTNALTAAVQKAIQANGITCPSIQKLQYSQFGKFPGYTKSYNGYKPPSFLSSLGL